MLRRRLAVSSLIALWGALLAAMLGRYAWPFDLFAHFRVQYTLLFLIVSFTFIQIPAMFFLVIWFAQQVLFGYLDYVRPTGEGGGVAYFAHIGGFVFGVVAVTLFARRRRRDYDQPRYSGF